MASSATKRIWWRDLRCDRTGTVLSPEIGYHGCKGGPIHPIFEESWEAFSTVITATGYRVFSCWCYVCRKITGGILYSLHSYPGLARDVNPKENPYRRTPTGRPINITSGGTQATRALLVASRELDTTFTPFQVEQIKAIKYKNGQRAFRWGGDWTTVKDAMHFEPDANPTVTEAGIDWSTVYGHGTEPEMSRYFHQGTDDGDNQGAIAEAQSGYVLLGHDLGEWGPDGDGVDGVAGGDTFAAVLAERQNAAADGFTISYDDDFMGGKDWAWLTKRLGGGGTVDQEARDAAENAQGTADAALAAGGQALIDAERAHQRLDGITVPE